MSAPLSSGRTRNRILGVALIAAVWPLAGGCPMQDGGWLDVLLGGGPTRADGRWRLLVTSAPASGDEEAIVEDFGEVTIDDGVATSARSAMLGILSSGGGYDPNDPPLILFDGQDIAGDVDAGFASRFRSAGRVGQDGAFEMTWIIEQAATGPYAALFTSVLFEMRLIFEGRLESDDLIVGTMRFEWELNPTLAAFFEASEMDIFGQADSLSAQPLPFRMERIPDDAPGSAG
jgi:hypothetical protein